MSVVAYYVRLSPNRLDELAELGSPDWVFSTSEVARRLPGAKLLYLDKAYEAIGWLLSPLKRVECDHMHRLVYCRDESRQVVLARVRAMKAMPVDPFLEAIEGTASARDERFGFGLGVASVFYPDRVRELSAILNQINRSKLESLVEPQEMVRVHLCDTVDDVNGLIDEYVWPHFLQLTAFYKKAADEDQALLVMFS